VGFSEIAEAELWMQLAMERCIVGDHRRHATTTSHPKFEYLHQWDDEGFDLVLGLSHGLLSIDSRDVGSLRILTVVAQPGQSQYATIVDRVADMLTVVTFLRHTTVSGCCVRAVEATNSSCSLTFVLYERLQQRGSNPLAIFCDCNRIQAMLVYKVTYALKVLIKFAKSPWI
jgi:hypothetical protein